MNKGYDVFAIISKFRTDGKIDTVRPFGSGHINDTYLAGNADQAGPDYLLQRVNHHVFKNVPGLMENFRIITAHIRAKLIAEGGDPDKEVLTLIPTTSGKNYTIDDEGNYWRLCLFLPDTRSYDKITNTKQAFEGGRAFGKFQNYLADIDPDTLVETIPDFHNIINRLEKLDKAVLEDRFNRAGSVREELAFIAARANDMGSIARLGNQGKLPLRITHNDTKFNNVLLNANDEAQCVIDLDTVMPGYVAFDFGDAVRTTINTAAEDEADLDKIDLNLELFEAYVQGYLQEVISLLTPKEVGSLVMGALLLPYMQGVRFITDYIEGDHYFKIHSPTHNLQRARAQFRLVEKLEENMDNLNLIINRTVLALQQSGPLAI